MYSQAAFAVIDMASLVDLDDVADTESDVSIDPDMPPLVSAESDESTDPDMLTLVLLESQAYLDGMADTESDEPTDIDMDVAESDESTDDAWRQWDPEEPCQCPQPTRRLSIVPGETVHRCFECCMVPFQAYKHVSMRVRKHASR